MNNAALNMGVHILTLVLISSLFFFIVASFAYVPRIIQCLIWGLLSIKYKLTLQGMGTISRLDEGT